MRDRTPHKFGGIDGQSDEEENPTQGSDVDESDARRAAEAFKGKNTSKEDCQANEAVRRIVAAEGTGAQNRARPSAMTA